MLDEYRQLYKVCADSSIDNWKTIDRNDLCRFYVDNKNELSEELKNAYFSAIVYKFWNLIRFTYNKQEGSLVVLSVEDCYELLIESIIYVLERAVWNNSESSLYNDKKAPEKAISIRMKSISGNEKYLSLFTNKKKINNLSYSLDDLQEKSSDGYYLKNCYYTLDDIYFNDIINDYMIYIFNTCDYFKAIVFDIICNDNCCDKLNNLDYKKICRKCRKLDLDYFNYFIKNYSNLKFNSNHILMSINLIKELKNDDIFSIINNIKIDIKNMFLEEAY